MNKTIPRDNLRALIVKKIAERHRVTPDYVYKVTDGTRTNEEILSSYMELSETIKDVFDNDLVNAVKKLIPLN